MWVSTRSEQSSAAQEHDRLHGRASENRSITAWVMGFWILAALAGAFWLKVRYDLRSDLSCPVPGTKSTSGKSSWQWLPPGEVCAFPGTDLPTQYPSFSGAVIGAVLVALPFVVVPLWVWSEVRIRNRLGYTP